MTSSVGISRPADLPSQCRATGGWRTNCTGRWMGRLRRAAAGCAKGQGAARSNILPQAALELFKNKKAQNFEVKNKRLLAASDENHLEQILVEN